MGIALTLVRKWLVAAAIVLVVPALFGAYKAAKYVNSCRIVYREDYLHLPPKGRHTGYRFFVIPGLSATAETFMAVPAARAWIEGLAEQGNDVIVLNTPVAYPCVFRGGGYAYRDKFFASFDHIITDAEARYGKRPSIIAGMSFGGMHALLAFAHWPGRFQSWQASMPVTKMGDLHSYAYYGDKAALDVFAIAPKLRGSTGFITWGQKDMTVDHRLDEKLYSLIKSPDILANSYPVGHMTSMAEVRDLLVDAKRQTGRLK